LQSTILIGQVNIPFWGQLGCTRVTRPFYCEGSGSGTGSRININFSLGIIIIRSGTDYFRCSSLAFDLAKPARLR